MKYACTLFVVAMVLRAGADEYVNIDEMLSDKAVLEEFVTCFLETAPCSEFTASFKKDVPVALLHSCEKCTPEQKHIVNAFIVSFKKHPQHYQAFKKIYDPDNKYLHKLEEAVTGF